MTSENEIRTSVEFGFSALWFFSPPLCAAVESPPDVIGLHLAWAPVTAFSRAQVATEWRDGLTMDLWSSTETLAQGAKVSLPYPRPSPMSHIG